MRNFLLDKNIVACVGVWQEGKNLHYCFDNLLKWCNYIVVVMDWSSKETEDFVMSYKNKYPDIFYVEYSGVPKLINPKNVKRRAKVYGSQLVEAKLKLVKKIHEEVRPVDILLTPDSDEVFTDYFPNLLEEFIKTNKTSICIKSIDAYEIPTIIHNKGMISHWRVYKYNPSINFTPRRYRDFYNPYRWRDTWHDVIGYFVHLSRLNENLKLRDILRDSKLIDSSPNTKLWYINKPAWELSPEEYKEIILTNPTWILKDYEKFPDKY